MQKWCVSMSVLVLHHFCKNWMMVYHLANKPPKSEICSAKKGQKCWFLILQLGLQFRLQKCAKKNQHPKIQFLKFFSIFFENLGQSLQLAPT
jgi:hypothetical protein